jgi:hypothetical protein
MSNTLDLEESFKKLTKEQSEYIFNQLQNVDYDDVTRIRKTFYIDLQYIQDIKIGAISSLIQNEEEYNYFLSCLDDYNDKLYNKHASYFPNLNISENELDKYITTSKYIKFLVATSPLTSTYLELKKLLDNIHANNVRNKELYPDYKIYVNIYPWNIKKIKEDVPKDLNLIIEIIKSKFLYIHKDIKIYLIDHPLSQINLSLFDTFDLIFIYNLEHLLGNEKLREHFFYRGLSKEIIIRSPIRFDADISDKTEDEILHYIKIGAASMSVICNFDYIHPKILVEDDEDTIQYKNNDDIDKNSS